jgi:hypothetical protein
VFQHLTHAIHIAALGQIRHDTPAARITSPNKPKARVAKKRCAALNDGSARPSTDSSVLTPPAALFAASLVDELHLMVFPLVLGRGKTLFDGNGKRTRMPRREARTVGDGITILTYGPIR